MDNPGKKDIIAFLAAKKATETEGEIYKFMVKRLCASGMALQNITIAEGTKRYRTTVYYHLRRMVKKGLIKKSGKIHYVPVLPRTAA